MKKIVAIILICICSMALLCACQREADMVETMVSDVLTPENNNTTAADNRNDGTVSDHDGYIGNENSETRVTDSNHATTTDKGSVTDDNVM